MNKKRAVLMAMVLAAVFASGSTWADRGHFGGHRFERGYSGGHHHGGLGWVPGLVLGSALVWAVTRPPTVVYQEPVRTVIVQEPEPAVVVAPPPSNQWWYYCRSAGAYYPYVASCPTGWEKVPATP